MTKNRLKKSLQAILLTSILFYIISLTQIGFSTDIGTGWYRVYYGWELLAFGIFGGLVCWGANPLILVAWIFLFKFEKFAIGCGILASVLALSFLCVDTITTQEIFQGPCKNYISEYKLGYWLWLISILLFTLGVSSLKIIIVTLIRKKRSENN